MQGDDESSDKPKETEIKDLSDAGSSELSSKDLDDVSGGKVTRACGSTNSSCAQLTVIVKTKPANPKLTAE